MIDIYKLLWKCTIIQYKYLYFVLFIFFEKNELLLPSIYILVKANIMLQFTMQQIIATDEMFVNLFTNGCDKEKAIAFSEKCMKAWIKAAEVADAAMAKAIADAIATDAAVAKAIADADAVARRLSNSVAEQASTRYLEDEASKSWVCHICTCRNHGNLPTCVACDACREVLPALPPIAGRQYNDEEMKHPGC
jgi:hypothetical protein